MLFVRSFFRRLTEGVALALQFLIAPLVSVQNEPP